MSDSALLQTYGRQPISFSHGVGATVFDDKGKEYIDFTSGIGVVSVGHSHPQLSKALCVQIERITHISNLYEVAPQEEAAQKLQALCGEYYSFFGNSGAEANEGAIKIARKYGEQDGEPKRYKIVTLEHSFHGRTITALKATAQEAMHNYFGPFPDGFVYAKSIDDIEPLLDDHTVAVMIELVQGEGGVEPLDKSKVQALSQLLKRKDILLIVDEVQTGVFRTGEMLASQLYEITPDVITLAKGLGGGIPIGVVMTRLKDIFKPGDHGSTFGGNYVSSVAAVEVMKILTAYYESGNLHEHMLYFDKALSAFSAQHQRCFNKTVGLGFMRGLRLKQGCELTSIIEHAREEGLLVLKAGRNTLRFLPPLLISKGEIDEGFARLNSAMSRC